MRSLSWLASQGIEVKALEADEIVVKQYCMVRTMQPQPEGDIYDDRFRSPRSTLC